MVIGDRNVQKIPHFSPLKRLLQRWGSWAVRRISGTNIPDCTSGFRAYNREAALRINIVSQFTYTLESIIQGGKKSIAIAHVPVRTNEQVRKSRLFATLWEYIKRSLSTIVRIYTMYEAFKVFIFCGTAILLVGAALAVRFLLRDRRPWPHAITHLRRDLYHRRISNSAHRARRGSHFLQPSIDRGCALPHQKYGTQEKLINSASAA